MSQVPEYKLYKSPNGWYSMVVPAHWVQMVIEGIPAFFEENGSGALQVYAFENKVGSYILKEELERYLKTHEIDFEEDKVADFENEEGSKIMACEFVKEDRFWMVYMIANKKRMILLTYNSDEVPAEYLVKELTTVISSIRFSQ
ncbi:hypothetical protein EHO98_12775 [Leptospira stimsonii]|uniref:DUF3805 domain-containing protein n=1 Tax=Leptospira stimsonii TaxID=2202203 RepID=A0A4R9L7T3_9LEPT|nr:hypothetical protein DLM78_19980 [Leptospira stimsonii]RHX87019.1 hypothetical protein DLM75_18760 [Leptospira stimsonii]TGK18476.1 hypothetical protein EHO98_12775 [Leptospira stimsonii]TGM21884.1 hypothetical protein EHQ90_01750 [Leptospira stimsonii]